MPGVRWPTVFTKNRDRLLEAEVAKEFSGAGGAASARAGLGGGRTFYGGRHRLLEAWASAKKFQPKDKKGC